MPTADISAAIDASLKGLRLLDHPYYQAWQEGQLTERDLSAYAGQYRHFERSLPEVLSEATAQMDPGRPHDMVQANLDDERSQPRPHLDLFDQFAAAVGADPEAPATPATQDLVGLYHDAATAGPLALLSVVGAYECQAAAIATTKSQALSELYGLDSEGTEFWAVHGTLEDRHSAWTVEALEGLDASPALVQQWAGRSAQAWWAFLDEREAARAA